MDNVGVRFISIGDAYLDEARLIALLRLIGIETGISVPNDPIGNAVATAVEAING